MNLEYYPSAKSHILEDLIYDYSFDKTQRQTWNKIKRFFFMDELPDDMIDLIDEIHHNLNQHGLQLLQIALTSKKARNEILDRIEVLKENYDGKHRINITDPEARKNAHERRYYTLCILIANSNGC